MRRPLSASATLALLGGPVVFIAAAAGLAQWIAVGAPAPREDGWAVWVTGVGTGVLGLAALVTLGFVVSQLAEGQRTRHGQLLTELQRLWTEPVMTGSWSENGRWASEQIAALARLVVDPAERKPTDGERAAWASVTRYPDFMEMLGSLVAEKALTADAAYRMWGGEVIDAWQRWHPAIEVMRTTLKQPDLYCNFSELVREMRAIHAARAALTS